MFRRNIEVAKVMYFHMFIGPLKLSQLHQRFEYNLPVFIFDIKVFIIIKCLEGIHKPELIEFG